MLETWRRVIEEGNGLVYFQRACDCVEEDYGQRMEEVLRRNRADMVFGGVLRVRGKTFKRAGFYEYEELFISEEGKWKLLDSKYLQFGLCGCMMKKEIWEKIQNIEERGQLFAALNESRRTAVYHDYKYYYMEEDERGFYEETSGKPVDYFMLQQRYEDIVHYFPDFSDRMIWMLFSRKEKYMLTHPSAGKAICKSALWINTQWPELYCGLNKAADRLMERLAKPDKRLQRLFEESEGQERIVILGTPEYHNLGDHAIAFAQERFVREFFPDAALLEVTEREITAQWKLLKKKLKRDDILLLQGGGNMGDAYESIEELRLRIIKEFAHNRIVLMPQTIHFTDRPEAASLKARMQKIYGAHERLLLNAREQTSYRRMEEYFPSAAVRLCPDIVMSLNLQKELLPRKRNGIYLLLRTDAEGTIDTGQLAQLKKLCGGYTDTVVMTETSLSYGVSRDNRREELFAKWNQLAGADLVITDRLHGMIFSALTGTPCIVLANYNHKVAESYEWLKELDYIHFCEDFAKLAEELESVQGELSGGHVYENNQIQKYYECLANNIRTM